MQVGEIEISPFQPFMLFMGTEDNQQVGARVVNIASKFNLGPEVTGINLQMLAQMYPELGGKCVKERMAAVFFRLSHNMPCLRNKTIELGLERVAHLGRDQTKAICRRALVLLYETGSAVITGTVDEAISRYMAHQFCLMLANKVGIPAVMTDFVMTNIVMNCQMQYGVNLDLLASSNRSLGQRIAYDPHKFPMAVVHSASYYDAMMPQHDRKTKALISSRGCINITGVRSLQAGIDFLNEIFPEMYRVQVDPKTGGLLHMFVPHRTMGPSPTAAAAAAVAYSRLLAASDPLTPHTQGDDASSDEGDSTQAETNGSTGSTLARYRGGTMWPNTSFNPASPSEDTTSSPPKLSSGTRNELASLLGLNAGGSGEGVGSDDSNNMSWDVLVDVVLHSTGLTGNPVPPTSMNSRSVFDIFPSSLVDPQTSFVGGATSSLTGPHS